MTKYSSINIVYRLQKWMDSVPGQTFLNYAYSWGASIVILGTLFKLTHIKGADLMLWLGMGTEVVVFFLSAFDRPFDKTADGMELPTHVGAAEGVTVAGAVGTAEPTGAEPYEPDESDEGYRPAVAAAVSGGGVSGGVSGGGVIGGGSVIVGGGGTVGGGEGAVSGGGVVAGGGGGQTIIIGGGGGGGYRPAGAGEGHEGNEAVEPNKPIDFTENGEAAEANVPASIPPLTPDMTEATNAYVDELKKLTEVLERVSEQSRRLTTDSEEMENLNRTLTGICKVYEMQLKSASSQIGTIDEINEQTRHMAEQIKELNNIYARMIEAMSVRMASDKG